MTESDIFSIVLSFNSDFLLTEFAHAFKLR